MIYLCIPAYNEETTIGVVLWKVRQIMAELPRDYQLLVADDGSTDRTADVLEPYTRVLPLTVMRTDERRGYAASLEMLIRECVSRSDYPKRDAIIVLQADFTQDPGHLPNLIKRVESGADIVISQAVEAAGASRRDRLARSLCLRLLRGIDWPEQTFDPLTGFNAYRLFCVKRAIDKLDGARLLSWDGPLANAELLRATFPFARRVDCVELVMRPDRRQRDSRVRFMPTFQGVLAFRRGRRTEPLLPIDRLKPARVMGAAPGQRNLLVDSVADGNTGGSSGSRRRRSQDSARRGASRGRRGRADSKGDSPKEGRRSDRSRRRRGGRRRKKSASSGDGGSRPHKSRPAAQDADSAASEERSDTQADSNKSDGSGRSQRPRSRGRRGGRRRRGSRGGGKSRSQPAGNDTRADSAGVNDD